MPKTPAVKRTKQPDSDAATPLVDPAPKRRQQYHSPLRRQQAAETRARIVAAGATVVHGLTAWDWKNLTARAVAEIAGVSERTVHRHFPTERKLRDAVLQRLVEESGVQLEQLTVGNFHAQTARLLRYLSSFAAVPATVEEPLHSIDAHRRDVVLAAVTTEAAGWSPDEQTAVAAMLDALWNVPTYERLTTAWGMEAESAVGAITWVIELIQTAVREGNRPGMSAPADF